MNFCLCQLLSQPGTVLTQAGSHALAILILLRRQTSYGMCCVIAFVPVLLHMLEAPFSMKLSVLWAPINGCQ